MKLYTYFRSSAAFRVRIALNVKDLRYESLCVHLAKGEHRRPEYAKVNPQGLLPTLELDDGIRLNQSLAIIEYLEDKPASTFAALGRRGKARVRGLAALVACEIHPLNNLRVLQHLKRSLGQSEEQVNAWYRHWIADGLAKLEAQLDPKASFAYGDAPTMADCCLVPQIFNAKRYDCDLAPYPTTMRVFEQCMRLRPLIARNPRTARRRMSYRRPYRGTQPDYLFPPYASTVKRAPSQPLVVLPHTLSELTAPVFGYSDSTPTTTTSRASTRASPASVSW